MCARVVHSPPVKVSIRAPSTIHACIHVPQLSLSLCSSPALFARACCLVGSRDSPRSRSRLLHLLPSMLTLVLSCPASVGQVIPTQQHSNRLGSPSTCSSGVHHASTHGLSASPGAPPACTSIPCQFMVFHGSPARVVRPPSSFLSRPIVPFYPASKLLKEISSSERRVMSLDRTMPTCTQGCGRVAGAHACVHQRTNQRTGWKTDEND